MAGSGYHVHVFHFNPSSSLIPKHHHQHRQYLQQRAHTDIVRKAHSSGTKGDRGIRGGRSLTGETAGDDARLRLKSPPSVNGEGGMGKAGRRPNRRLRRVLACGRRGSVCSWSSAPGFSSTITTSESVPCTASRWSVASLSRRAALSSRRATTRSCGEASRRRCRFKRRVQTSDKRALVRWPEDVFGDGRRIVRGSIWR